MVFLWFLNNIDSMLHVYQCHRLLEVISVLPSSSASSM